LLGRICRDSSGGLASAGRRRRAFCSESGRFFWFSSRRILVISNDVVLEVNLNRILYARASDALRWSFRERSIG
jgi:hypothetical protein